MTDDIVTRLLDFTPWSDADLARTMLEAADEIERLQAEIDTLSNVIRKLNGDGVIYFRDKAVRDD